MKRADNFDIDCAQLVEAFYTAFNAGRFTDCHDLVARLEARCQNEPRFNLWQLLLEGILIYEQGRDWGELERRCLHILGVDMGDGLLTARAALALALGYAYTGRYAEAISLCQQCLPAFDALPLPIDQASARNLIAIASRLGFTQGDLGQDVLDLAARHCHDALTILGRATPTAEITSLEAAVWNTLGNLFLVMRNWDKAIHAFQQHLNRCLGLDQPCRAIISYNNLGQAYRETGAEGQVTALAMLGRGLKLAQQCQDRLREAEVLETLAHLHAEMGQPELAADVFDLALACLDELRAVISSQPARVGYFSAAASIFAHAILLNMDLGRHDHAFDLVERARSRSFLDLITAKRIEASSPSSSTLLESESSITLALNQVQMNLEDDTLLMVYYSTGLVEASDRGRNQQVDRYRFPPSRTLLFAVTRQSLQVFDLDLSPNDLLPRSLESVVERHFLDPRILRRLYDKLIGPVERLLHAKQKLYIAPHGPLHYLPFAALLAGDGRPLLRNDGPALIFGPSASVLFRPRRLRPTPATASCLTVGFDGSGAQRLRFAEDEARFIAHQMGGRALVGAGNKKEALLAQAGEYRLLHFSCHGRFDPADPLASALHLGPAEILTAQEAMDALHLRADLVTLSACESGLNRVRRGDELMGLVRGFMAAGAPAVVATLWRVDERSTRLLMERFYEGLNRGLDHAHALKEAQLYLRNLAQGEAPEGVGGERPFAEPFHWAPFVLIESGLGRG